MTGIDPELLIKLTVEFEPLRGIFLVRRGTETIALPKNSCRWCRGTGREGIDHFTQTVLICRCLLTKAKKWKAKNEMKKKEETHEIEGN